MHLQKLNFIYKSGQGANYFSKSILSTKLVFVIKYLGAQYVWVSVMHG